MAAERVAAEDRFDPWERANKERAEESRATRERRQAVEAIHTAVAPALELSLAPDAILEIVQKAVAKEAR